jgi:hypothetical protein
LVGDAQARDLLLRAIHGRGAFRRFKDALFDFPELREEWFAFHYRRMRRRAIEWLVRRELITEDVAKRAITGSMAKSQRVSANLDQCAWPSLQWAELGDLYGDRLAQVLLYGSQARGDLGPESDIDLLMVLRDMDSPWDELRRMDDLLWRLSLEHGVTLSALPVTVDQFEHPAKPVLIEARSHGETVV